MKEQLITFETAVLAKEKGFDAWCYAWFYERTLVSWQADIMSEEVGIKRNYKNFQYKAVKFNDEDTTYAAPTQSLLQKWLREVHNLHLTVRPRFKGTLNDHIVDYSYNGENGERNNHFYKTYEDALEEGLQEALKLIDK